jgi:hypothetical protein
VYFLVLSSGRSGTQLLCNALNQHPDITVSPEILNFTHIGEYVLLTTTCRELVTKWRESLPNRPKCVGTLVHRDLYGKHTKGDCWRDLKEMHSKVVGIYRENALRRYVSSQIAIQHQDWTCSRLRAVNPDKVIVPVRSLERSVQHDMRLREEGQRRFPDQLEVSYKELCQDWGGKMTEIQRYLGVPACSLPMRTFKQETRVLRDCISNFEEVATFLRGTDRDHWLED